MTYDGGCPQEAHLPWAEKQTTSPRWPEDAKPGSLPAMPRIARTPSGVSLLWLLPRRRGSRDPCGVGKGSVLSHCGRAPREAVSLWHVTHGLCRSREKLSALASEVDVTWLGPTSVISLPLMSDSCEQVLPGDRMLALTHGLMRRVPRSLRLNDPALLAFRWSFRRELCRGRACCGCPRLGHSCTAQDFSQRCRGTDHSCRSLAVHGTGAWSVWAAEPATTSKTSA
jgi:hypothetical protein